MRRIRSITVSALTFLAVGAITAPLALAASNNNPYWSLCVANEAGKFASGCEAAGTTFEQFTLGEGENKEAKASGGTQLLPVSGGTVVANKLKFATGASVLGSKEPNPGTSGETIEFEETSVKGAPECKIEQSKKPTTVLTTLALRGKLAFQTKAAAEAEEGPTVTILEPASGSTFMEFELVGATCPTTGTQTVLGSLALENVEGAKYKEKHESKSGSSTSYFVNESGATVAKTAEIKDNGTKVIPLVVFGLAIGASLIFASVAR